MKSNLLDIIKKVLADRAITALIIAIILLSSVYCMYVGFSLHGSDLQIAVHYSAYGETTLYRDKWYYLISFIFFGVVVALVHSALIIKLYLEERRHLAVNFAYLTLMIIFIAFILAHSVLGVAFL